MNKVRLRRELFPEEGAHVVYLYLTLEAADRNAALQDEEHLRQLNHQLLTQAGPLGAKTLVGGGDVVGDTKEGRWQKEHFFRLTVEPSPGEDSSAQKAQVREVERRLHESVRTALGTRYEIGWEPSQLTGTKSYERP